jgi:hypothetical protein
LNYLNKEEIMNTTTPSRHTGRKIWIGVAITISALILLLSAVGVVGVWVVENKLSDATVSLLQSVYDFSGGLRQQIERADQGIEEVRQITAEVSQISSQISQNVEDQGLLALLLPQEQEDKLVESMNSIQETLGTIREFLASTIEMYSAINSIPFVNLPTPSLEQMEQLETTLSGIQADIATLQQNIQDFRAGAADMISRVTEAADKITAGLGELSGKIENLDQVLLALQDFSVRMQTTLPTLFVVMALVISLFLAWVTYTQVEVIRMYVQRWKALEAPEAAKEEIKIVESE